MNTFLRSLAAFTFCLVLFTAVPHFTTTNTELSPVESVPQRARVIGYDRDALFGGWQTGVRESIVEQAGPDDPYSGAPLEEDAEVDHILPLSAAWDLGAHAWTPAQRIRFANDPNNLILVSREQNQEKSDQLPSQWLPKKREVRCWYVEKLSFIAFDYQLPLPEADIATAKRQCGFAKFW